MKSGEFHFQRSKEGVRSAPIERDGLAGYRAATDGLKKVPAEVAATI